MPIEFLTEAQVAAYGRFAGAPTRAQLERFFFLDDAYRRQIGARLNLHESRHQLARRLFHGQRGELRQRYREGQEDQLGALGLVLNAVVLWNTPSPDAALARLRQRGYAVREADVFRLAPFGFAHLNVHGRYTFTPFTLPAPGQLRPLRDSVASEDDEA